jgi:sulfur relay protein TusB/DsrH
MLHLLFQSPIDCSILKRIDSGDDIVCHENAIFAITKNGVLKNEIQNMLNNNIHFYALNDELEIRGISIVQLVMGIETIDYFRLVELTEKNQLIRTWN